MLKAISISDKYKMLKAFILILGERIKNFCLYFTYFFNYSIGGNLINFNFFIVLSVIKRKSE